MGQWAGTVALLALVVLFNLALVLLLSTAFRARGAVLAVPLAGLMGADLVTGFAPQFGHVSPWILGRVGGAVLGAGVTPDGWPVAATLVWTALALLGALWLFKRQEL